MKNAQHRHIEHAELQQLLSGGLSPEQEIELLTMICECDHCAEILYDAAEKMPQISLPAESCSRTMKAAGFERRKQNKESLFAYAFRVVASVCAALVLLFSGVFSDAAEFDVSGTLKSSSDFLRSVTEILMPDPARGFDEIAEDNVTADEKDYGRRYSDHE